MEVFLVLKYKLALLPIWEPSNFVLFKIPILMKYCIYNVSLKGSLQWQLKWTCILQFSISPSKAVSCLKYAKLKSSASCLHYVTMWVMSATAVLPQRFQPKSFLQLSIFPERAFGIASSWKCNFCACTEPKSCFCFDHQNWWSSWGTAAAPSVLSDFCL